MVRRTPRSVLVALTAVATIAISAHAHAESPGGKLQKKNPNVNYTEGTDFMVPVNPTPAGNSVAAVTSVDYASADSGCEAADFTGFPAGNIALVSRGTCLFADKVVNAQAAGASGILIANNVPGLITPSLADTPGIDIPALLITKDLGDSFAALATGGLRVHIQVKKN